MDSPHGGSWILECTGFPCSGNLLHARQMASPESLHTPSAMLPPVLFETARTYTNGLLQSEVVFSLLFPVSCNIPHYLITYFIISFINYIIFPLICNYFSHYFPVIFFRFRQHPLCFYFFLLSSPFTAICFPSFPHEFHPAAVPRRLSSRGIRGPFRTQCDAHNIRPVPLSPGSEVHPAHGSVPSR